ncbi:MAG: prepilin-type N-terminal cleavage/methylation domain-containing protein [Polyangiaceae bacterium]|nr:prepilin-type N-terminal cleavage/methylation domain-containing protein [Polyangiaceae bacterium]
MSPFSTSLHTYAKQRGFTLTELMVALTGGLFISTVVFVLARDSTRFYQRESRMANANLSEIIGFQRLSADIARAGFLSSPNIRREPTRLCGPPLTQANLWPTELANLSSIMIKAGEVMPAELTGQVAPVRLRLAGAYSSAEQFGTRTVKKGAAAGTTEVYLQPNLGPMQRLGYGTSTDPTALLQSVFPAGRALRLVDKEGKVQYGTITGVVADASPRIILGNRPAIQFREDGSLCGFHDLGEGTLVNVVNFVVYEIRNIQNATAYPDFVRAIETDPAVIAATRDTTRTDLIRVELDVDGNEITNTRELVAEYAVDLRFGLTVVENASTSTPVTAPLLETIPSTDADVLLWAGLPSGLGDNIGPEFIRSVRTRLSVRSRDPDRDTNITPNSTVAPGLYRIGLGANGAAPFARVRTMQADIALRNQR